MKRTILTIALTFLASLALATSNTRGESSSSVTAKGIFENALFNDIDSVNPYNGNLSVDIPIGQSYSVGPNLALQLSLFYNLSLWTDVHIITNVLEDPNYTPTCELLELSRFAISGRDTYGAGWDIHLGYISRQHIDTDLNGSYHYNAPDGSSHAFYPETSSTYRTHDGSYLKLTRYTTPSEYFKMEDGSGIVYTFGHPVTHYTETTGPRYCSSVIDFQYNRNGFYVTEIADPWGNKIEAAYVTSGGYSSDKIDTVTLRDGKNLNVRTIAFHYTTIQNSMDYDFCPYNQPCTTETVTYTYDVLTGIDLPTVGGATLSYTFQVENKLITRPDRLPGTLSCWAIDINNPCGTPIFPTQNTHYVPMLTSVSADDGGGNTYTYAFDYNYDAIPDLYERPDNIGNLNDEVGTLASITLPTGGRVDYTYMRTLRFSGPGACEPEFGEPREDTPPSIFVGVKTREYYNADDQLVGTYEYDLGGFDSVSEHLISDLISTTVTVTDSRTVQEVRKTRFTFDYRKVEPSEDPLGETVCEGEYPLHGSLVKEERLDSSGTVMNTVDYEYEYDDMSLIEACHAAGDCASQTLDIPAYSKNHNIRTKRVVSRYAKASGEDVTTTINEQWDSYGHFKRTKFYDGDVPSTTTITPLRESFTDFTPDVSHWILNTKDYSWVKDQNGSYAAYTKYQYASSGTHLGNHYLNAVCQYEKIYASNLAQTCSAEIGYNSFNYEVPDYSIMTYYPDITLIGETYDGLPNEEHLIYAGSSFGGTASPSFKIDNTYQYNLLTERRFMELRSNGVWLPFAGYLTKVVRDKTTGLVTRSYDETGSYFTATAFNKLGLPTSIVPPGEAAIYLSYQLDPASGMTVQTRRNTSTGPLQAEVLSDSFGHVKEERKYMPGGTYTKKVQQFDILGRTTFASAWAHPDTPEMWLSGTSMTYDGLGRILSTHKSGDPYPMTVAYDGTRSKTVRTWVQTSQQLQTESSTVYTYDAPGNLISVLDPLGNPTTYTYNGQGNLTEVHQGIQGRFFSYDLLGRMTSELHPEGKNIQYQGYNALGNVTEYKTYQDYLGTAFSYYFTNSYDYAGRLTRSEVSTQSYLTGDACTPDNSCYPLRELTYDNPTLTVTAADGSLIQGNLTVGTTSSVRGKLTMAKEYVIIDGNRSGSLSTGPCTVGVNSLTDVYQYASTGYGRITGRRLYSDGFAHGSTYPQTEKLYFSWGYNYDYYGNLASIDYPEAFDVATQQSLGLVKDETGTLLNRTVSYAYDNNYRAYLSGLSRPGIRASIIGDAFYNEQGLLDSIFYGEGLSGMEYQYDGLNRPRDIQGFQGVNGLEYVFKEIAMTYDSTGNLTYFHNAVIKPIDPSEPIEIGPTPVPIPIKCRAKWRNYYATYDAASRVMTYKKETEYYGSFGCDIFTNTFARNWTYDEYGNILQYSTGNRGNIFNATVDLPTNPVTNQLIGPDYDGRGNLVRGEPVDDDGNATTPDRRIHFYQYSPENKMATYFEDVWDAQAGQNKMVEQIFAYNWQGERTVALKRSVVESTCGDAVACWCVDQDPSVTSAWSLDTIYIRDEAGRILAEFDRQTDQLTTYSWHRYNYFAFGRMVAADGILDDMDGDGYPEALGRRYYYHDHLGSVRAVTDGYENFLMAYDYWPYGEEMYSSQWNEESYRYTGHERDYDLNLDYMHARHYSYGKGRFFSTDILNGSINRPQTLNLYSYTAGNPLNYVDPLGFARKGPQSANNTVTQEQCERTNECEWTSNGCECGGIPIDDLVFAEDYNDRSFDAFVYRTIMQTMSLSLDVMSALPQFSPTPIHQVLHRPLIYTSNRISNAWSGHPVLHDIVNTLSSTGTLVGTYYFVSSSVAATTAQVELAAYIYSIGGEQVLVPLGFAASGLSIATGSILAVGSFGAGYSIGVMLRKYTIPPKWNQLYGDAMYNGMVITTNFYGITYVH